jgi:class 3 adenylate cyclase/tetratricopeptide (TPR) repeat protein
MDKRELRKLAAIMFTDIVGYSALMGKNEALTLELLEEHNCLLRPIFVEHGGQEIKCTGDGFMVEFASALQAVRCAVAMQKALTERNALEQADHRIQIRIGIHLGDVVYRGDDLLGDGVNIAARIEPLAEPGGICLSEDVARQIENKIETPLQKLGQGELKNIELPVNIYRVALTGQQRPPVGYSLPHLRRKQRRWLALLLSVLILLGGAYVLPIMTGGLADDRKDPGVSRITARLPDARAQEFYDRGIHLLTHNNDPDNLEAISNLKEAVRIDPNFAEAHAALAAEYERRAFLFSPEEEKWETEAYVEVNKALRLNKNLAEAHYALGRYFWSPASGFRHEQAIQEFQTALRLNPNDSEAHNWLGMVYGHIGLLDNAEQEFNRAIVLNPNSMAVFTMGYQYLSRQEYQKVIDYYRTVDDKFFPSLIGYAVAQAQFGLGQPEEAEQTLKHFLALEKGKDTGGVLNSTQALLYASAGNKEKALEAIRAAREAGKGFGHFHHAEYTIASAYALMHEYKQAIEALKHAAQDGFPCYPLFENDPNLNNLRADAEFRSFMAEQKRQWLAFKTKFPAPY